METTILKFSCENEVSNLCDPLVLEDRVYTRHQLVVVDSEYDNNEAVESTKARVVGVLNHRSDTIKATATKSSHPNASVLPASTP